MRAELDELRSGFTSPVRGGFAVAPRQQSVTRGEEEVADHANQGAFVARSLADELKMMGESPPGLRSPSISPTLRVAEEEPAAAVDMQREFFSLTALAVGLTCNRDHSFVCTVRKQFSAPSYPWQHARVPLPEATIPSNRNPFPLLLHFRSWTGVCCGKKRVARSTPPCCTLQHTLVTHASFLVLQGVQFHQYHQWLQQRITRRYFQQVNILTTVIKSCTDTTSTHARSLSMCAALPAAGHRGLGVSLPPPRSAATKRKVS